MAIIPMHNETDYALTESMKAEILRDAHEHFGEDVRLIRVQAGLKRHSLNARTREVRYAFSPQDFGVGVAPPLASPPPVRSAVMPTWTRRLRPRIAPALDEDIEDIAEDEALARRDKSLDSMDEGRDNDAAEDDPFIEDDHMEEDRAFASEEEEQ